jgi:hypothetical protein
MWWYKGSFVCLRSSTQIIPEAGTAWYIIRVGLLVEDELCRVLVKAGTTYQPLEIAV